MTEIRTDPDNGQADRKADTSEAKRAGERERDKERDRHTERQRDRETDREKDRETDRKERVIAAMHPSDPQHVPSTHTE